jgi:hypothetical protein
MDDRIAHPVRRRGRGRLHGRRLPRPGEQAQGAGPRRDRLHADRAVGRDCLRARPAGGSIPHPDSQPHGPSRGCVAPACIGLRAPRDGGRGDRLDEGRERRKRSSRSPRGGRSTWATSGCTSRPTEAASRASRSRSGSGAGTCGSCPSTRRSSAARIRHVCARSSCSSVRSEPCGGSGRRGGRQAP